jgi:hypothetical protein
MSISLRGGADLVNAPGCSKSRAADNGWLRLGEIAGGSFPQLQSDSRAALCIRK